jgi:hypothetical protein
MTLDTLVQFLYRLGVSPGPGIAAHDQLRGMFETTNIIAEIASMITKKQFEVVLQEVEQARPELRETLKALRSQTMVFAEQVVA